MNYKNNDNQMDIDQNALESIFSLGANFFVQGKYDKAEIIFDGLLALNPNNLNAALALGEVLMMHGQYQKALEHFLAQRELGLSDSRILLGAARAYHLLGDYHKAKLMVKPIVDCDVVSSNAVLLMAQLIQDRTIP